MLIESKIKEKNGDITKEKNINFYIEKRKKMK